jgi:hypothetical protein
LRLLAPVLENRLSDLTDRLTARLRQEIPHYAAMAAQELRDQAEMMLRYVLSELGGKPVASENGPAAYGRIRAEQGVPPEVVLRAFRVAWAELWSGLLAAADDEGGLSSEELLQASTDVFWMADNYAERMLVAYRKRAVELLVRQEAERSATLEGVFSGYLHGAEALWEAAALLDLPYEGLFIVVAATTPVAGREALPGIKQSLFRAKLNSSWRLGPDIEAGIVSLRTRTMLGPLLHELSAYEAVHAALSAPYTRLADTPHALHLARLVLGTIPDGTAEIKQFDESPVGALLAASPDTARELCKSVLGGLFELPEEDMKTLLLTLSTWFESAGSITEAAKRLYVHPNTVRYRLRRIQSETQRSLEDPRDVAEIRTALIAQDMIPNKRGS